MLTRGFQKMVLGALAAGALLFPQLPATAEPIGSTLTREKQNLLEKTHYPGNNKLNKSAQEKGWALTQDRGRLLRQGKGSGSAINYTRIHQDWRSTDRISSRALPRTLANTEARGNRKICLLRQERGRAFTDRGQRLRIFSVFRPKSTSTHRPVAVRPSAPISDLAQVRLALNRYVAQNSVGALFIQRDPVSHITYRLQFAQAPIFKMLGKDRAAMRCSFYGQSAANSPSIPVVIEITLRSQQNNWAFDSFQFVSVNGERRSGQFAFAEAELSDNAGVADSIQVEEDKEFPVKQAQ